MTGRFRTCWRAADVAASGWRLRVAWRGACLGGWFGGWFRRRGGCGLFGEEPIALADEGEETGLGVHFTEVDLDSVEHLRNIIKFNAEEPDVVWEEMQGGHLLRDV